MRNLLRSVAVFVIAATQHPVPSYACGEKLLVLGRGIRFQSRHTPRAASVLLYLPQTASQSLTDPNFETALREAGHTVRVVTTNGALQTALQSGAFDVVLVNVSHAADLEWARAVTARNVAVLPAVYLLATSQQQKRQAKADRVEATKEFGVVVEVPGRAGHYCAAVDKAMELKLKREQSASRRP